MIIYKHIRDIVITYNERGYKFSIMTPSDSFLWIYDPEQVNIPLMMICNLTSITNSYIGDKYTFFISLFDTIPEHIKKSIEIYSTARYTSDILNVIANINNVRGI